MTRSSARARGSTSGYHVLDGETGSHLCEAIQRTKKEAYEAASRELRELRGR